MTRRIPPVAAACVATLALAAAACGAPAPDSPDDVAFEEIPIDFVHFNGMSGQWYFCEMVGPGAALFDADGDGDLDLYLVQGAPLDARPPVVPHRGPGAPRGRLFRNDPETGPDGTRRPRFTDVTESSGIDARGYGMGAAVGDADGDGLPDLFLTHFGGTQLWRNRGGGRFEDWTDRAGVAVDGWSTSATFLDFDRDGHLDLYVCRYEDFSVATNKPCFTPSGARDYCGPLSYRPVPDRLLRNRGDGTFEDVSVRSRIASVEAPGLGCVALDADADGFPDVFVANDGRDNQLWMNGRDGTFRDEALARGCAVNSQGMTSAGMGTDAGDIDEDGDADLVVLNLTGEPNTLFLNDGRGRFVERADRFGLAGPSLPVTGFGAAFLDWDGDGRLDLVAANGAVRAVERPAGSTDPFPFGQRNQLFRNVGGRFEDVSARGGATFGRSEVSRGLAVGDLDDDGDLDLVVANNCGPARVFLNRVGARSPWIGLRVESGAPPSPAIGARVEIRTSSGRRLVRVVHADGSYLSSRDPRVLFGLGADTAVSLEVVWPDGTRESRPVPPTGRYTVVARAAANGAPGTERR